MKYGPGAWVVQHVERSGRPFGTTPPDDFDGYWKINKGGTSGKLYDYKNEAVSAAKQAAKDTTAQVGVVVENMDGSVSERVTYEGSESGIGTLEDMLG